MNTIYIIPPIFFVIAFVFSMLGMGGSQLYIPVLFWMGLDFKTQAIPLGMLLNMVESARGAKRIVALDGCQVACARKAIEHAGLKVTDWIWSEPLKLDREG